MYELVLNKPADNTYNVVVNTGDIKVVDEKYIITNKENLLGVDYSGEPIFGTENILDIFYKEFMNVSLRSKLFQLTDNLAGQDMYVILIRYGLIKDNFFIYNKNDFCLYLSKFGFINVKKKVISQRMPVVYLSTEAYRLEDENNRNSAIFAQYCSNIQDLDGLCLKQNFSDTYCSLYDLYRSFEDILTVHTFTNITIKYIGVSITKTNEKSLYIYFTGVNSREKGKAYYVFYADIINSSEDVNKLSFVHNRLQKKVTLSHDIAWYKRKHTDKNDPLYDIYMDKEFEFYWY